MKFMTIAWLWCDYRIYKVNQNICSNVTDCWIILQFNFITKLFRLEISIKTFKIIIKYKYLGKNILKGNTFMNIKWVTKTILLNKYEKQNDTRLLKHFFKNVINKRELHLIFLKIFESYVWWKTLAKICVKQYSRSKQEFLVNFRYRLP